jgi:hypothetical protein
MEVKHPRKWVDALGERRKEGSGHPAAGEEKKKGNPEAAFDSFKTAPYSRQVKSMRPMAV